MVFVKILITLMLLGSVNIHNGIKGMDAPVVGDHGEGRLMTKYRQSVLDKTSPTTNETTMTNTSEGKGKGQSPGAKIKESMSHLETGDERRKRSTRESMGTDEGGLQYLDYKDFGQLTALAPANNNGNVGHIAVETHRGMFRFAKTKRPTNGGKGNSDFHRSLALTRHSNEKDTVELGGGINGDDVIPVPLRAFPRRVRREVNESNSEEEQLLLAVTNGLMSDETHAFLATFAEPIQRDTVRLQLEMCPLISLCTFSLNISASSWTTQAYFLNCCQTCDCSLLYCMERSSCCPDIVPPTYFRLRDQYTDHNLVTLFSRNETDENETSSSVSNDFPFETKYNPSLHCTLGHAMANYDVLQDSWTMHSTCIVRTNQTVVAKCEQGYSMETVSDLEDIMPVTVSPSGPTYKNKYCAMCGGDSICEDCLLPWDIILSCDNLCINSDIKNNIIEYVFGSQTCEIKFNPSMAFMSVPPEPCTTSISSCNITGNWKAYDPVLERQCLLYRSVYSALVNSTLYGFQNVFCALCNGIEIDDVACPDPSSTTSVRFSFTGLLTFETYTTFNDLKAQQYADSGPGTCSLADGVYDPLTENCTETYCSSFFTKDNGDCIRLLNISTFGKYSVYVTLRPTKRINLTTIAPLTDNIIFEACMNYIFQTLMGTKFYSYYPIFWNEYTAFYTLKDSIKHGDLDKVGQEDVDLVIDRIHVQILFTYMDIHNVYDLYDKLKELNNEVMSYHFPYPSMKTIHFRLHVENDNMIFYELQTIVSKSQPPPGAHLYLDMSNDDARRLAQLARTSLVIVPYINFAGEPFDQSVYVDITTLLECPLIKLYQHQVNWKECADKTCISVKLNDTDSTALNISRYFHDRQDDGLLYACAEDYLDQFKQSIVLLNTLSSNLVKSDLEIIISVVCICVSLLCLFVTVVIYVVVPSLRTVPGLNILSLSVSLMLAQSLYLLTALSRFEQGSSACVMIGLLMHLMWLVSIFWMSGCTIHMFRVLTSSQQMTTSLVTHVLYHVYSTVASLVFVGINIGVSLARSKGSDMGYGRERCYFSDEDMLNYTFALPVLCVVLKNFTLFAVVAITLHRQNVARKHVKNERNGLLIFTKLSTLTGITWLVGFLYTWTTIEAMSYAFIVLNASQGLFIMLSFATNNRVYQVYKKAHSSTSSKDNTKRV